MKEPLGTLGNVSDKRVQNRLGMRLVIFITAEKKAAMPDDFESPGLVYLSGIYGTGTIFLSGVYATRS